MVAPLADCSVGDSLRRMACRFDLNLSHSQRLVASQSHTWGNLAYEARLQGSGDREQGGAPIDIKREASGAAAICGCCCPGMILLQHKLASC